MSTTNQQSQFQASHPFRFELLDDQFEPAIFINSATSNKQNELNVNIKNVSGNTILLGAFTNVNEDSLPNAEQHHFALVFRKGVLATQIDETTNTETVLPITLTNADWVISQPNEDATGDGERVIFYLAKTGAAASFHSASVISLRLSEIQAAPAGGTRSTLVQLKPGSLFTSNNHLEDHNLIGFNNELDGNIHLQNNPPVQILSTAEQTLKIINHVGNPNIPLHAAFVGLNTVLNDNQQHGSDYTLTLRITNVSNIKPINFDANSKFSFYFEAGTSEKEEWALGLPANLESISITPQGGNPLPKDITGLTPIWQATRLTDIPARGSIDYIFNLADFSTDFPAGMTYLHIDYNIKGYWSNTIKVPLEKQPLLLGLKTSEAGNEIASIESGNRPIVFFNTETAENGTKNYKERLRIQNDGKILLPKEGVLEWAWSGNKVGSSKGVQISLGQEFRGKEYLTIKTGEVEGDDTLQMKDRLRIHTDGKIQFSTKKGTEGGLEWKNFEITDFPSSFGIEASQEKLVVKVGRGEGLQFLHNGKIRINNNDLIQFRHFRIPKADVLSEPNNSFFRIRKSVLTEFNRNEWNGVLLKVVGMMSDTFQSINFVRDFVTLRTLDGPEMSRNPDHRDTLILSFDPTTPVQPLSNISALNISVLFFRKEISRFRSIIENQLIT